MASLTFTQHYADDTSQLMRRTVGQGRRKSEDPMLPVTVRIPRSWLADMGEDVRHYIRVAIHEKRTRDMVKH